MMRVASDITGIIDPAPALNRRTQPMISRRSMLWMTGAGLIANLGGRALAFDDRDLPGGLDLGYEIPPELQAGVVPITPGHDPGEIHVVTNRRWLYLTLYDGAAIRYPIAVGAAGLSFRGAAYIGDKRHWPRWQPTRNMIRREPEKYGPYAAGIPGGPQNPLGARALYLYKNGRDTLYRIHGTSQPWSIGRAGSSGCIRMFNSHVAHLFEQVHIGTRVVAHDNV
jgi:lipoprotein-anchoring transpeptidase ErfK/SrfK